MLLLQTLKPLGLLGAQQLRFRLFRQRKEIVAMSSPGSSSPPSVLDKPFSRILAHGLQQPVATSAVALLGTTTRLLSTSEVRRSSTSSSSTPPPAQTRSAAASVHPPANTESRCNSELLRIAQQVVAPVDQRAQRLLARQRRARTSCKESETLVQLAIDLLDRKRSHPRRRQFDGQRNPVQPITDGSERRRHSVA